jgi:GAF domain-containing protein
MGTHGGVIGVIYAEMSAGGFEDDAALLLALFANQAAFAIENARTFERVHADLAQAQQELDHLRINIDKKQVENKVGEIMDTEFFKMLSSRLPTLRSRRAQEDDGEAG